MKKNKLSKYLLFISISTFIATFFFVVQKSYENLMNPINEVKQSVIIKPIDPNLDISTLDAIEKRAYFDNSTTIPLTISPTPSPTI